MKKRGLSLFMVLVLCLTLLPTAAFAEGEDVSISGGVIGGGETGGEGGGIYVAPGSPTKGGGGTYIPGEDTRTEIRCVSKPDSIGRSYDGTTDGSTIPIDLTFTDGTNEIKLKEGTGFTAKKTFDSADAGWHTVTVEIALIGEAAVKYKLKAGEETFTIGGYIDKATPELTVSLSRTTCTVGEKLLPLLSVSGVKEDAAVTYYYTQYKTIAGDSEYEGSEAIPKIDENTVIDKLDKEGNNTYYVYAKTAATKNYNEGISDIVELTVSNDVASVTTSGGKITNYTTLIDAITALQDGDTLTLLTDVDVGDSLKIDRGNITFDLNNHKLYSTAASGITQILSVEVESGSVTLKNGTIEPGQTYTQAIYAWMSDGELRLENITAKVPDKSSREAVYLGGSGLTATIVSGNYQGLYLDSTVTAVLKGGTFRPYQMWDGSTGYSIFHQLDSSGFSSRDCMELLAEGCVYVNEAGEQVRTYGGFNYTVTVQEAAEQPAEAVAEIGDERYSSLREAIEAVRSGETITLLKSLDLGSGVVQLEEIDKDFTIDLGNNALKANAQYLVYMMEGKGHVTLQNGTLDGSSCTSYTIFVNGGHTSDSPRLTLKNVTATSGNGLPVVQAVLQGTVEFDGGTYTGGVLLITDGNAVLKNGTFQKGTNDYSIKTEDSGKHLSDYLDDDSQFWNDNTPLDLSNETQTADEVTVRPCKHNWENGKCTVCQKVCYHGSADGKSMTSDPCPTCGMKAAAQVDITGSDAKYFLTFSNALVYATKNNGCTLKLLANVTDPVSINTPFIFDLNGHNFNMLSVGARAKIRDSSTTKGTIKELKVFNMTDADDNETVLTVADLLEEGYAFKSSSGNKWYFGVENAITNVTVQPAPIKSVTAEHPTVTVEYGKTSGVTLTATAVLATEGGTVSYQWYKIGGTVFPIQDATKDTYQLPADLGAGTHTYRLTATSDGYPKSVDITVKVTPISLEGAEITVKDLAYNGESQFPTVTVKLGETTLTKNTDFYVDATMQTNAGSYTLTVNGNGNYSGEIKNVEWKIDPLPISLLSVSSISKTYDGSADVTLTADKLTFFSKTASRQDITLPNTALTFSDAQFTSKQEDGSYLPSPEVGGGKALSFTMTLTSNNYVFEGKSEGTTEVSDVFATDDVNRFTITKAAAPTDIQTGTLNVVNGTKLEYTYDAKQLLPKAPKGTYGKVSYNCEFPFNLKNGYYVDDIAIKDNILTLTIDALNGGETGKIGTIPVYVTTDNYASFNLPLDLYAVNKITPVADGEITAAGITYGDALSKSTISGKMKDPSTGATVNGTFTWTDGTIKPDANDRYEAEWRFTPDESYGGGYATVTGKTTVKVAPKSIEGAKVTLEADSFVYDGNEKTPVVKSVVLDNVTLTSLTDYGYIVVKKSNVGIYNFTITGDGNYTGEVKATWQITPREVTPTIEVASCTYTGDALEPTVTLKDGNTVIPTGEYTVEYSDNTNAGTGRVTIKDVAGGNYVIKEKTQDFTITKAAAPTNIQSGTLTITNGLHKTYSFDLSTLLPKLTAPCDYGTITYDKKVVTDLGVGAFVTLVDGKTGELTLEVVNRSSKDEGQFGTITVTISTGNYQDITLTINVIAKNRTTPTGTPTLSKNVITYGDALNTIALSGKLHDDVNNVDVDGTFAWEDGTFKPAANDSYQARWKFTPTNQEKYAEVTGTVTIKVNKAATTGEPKYTAIITSGKTLKDAALTTEGSTLKPNVGNLEWVDDEGGVLPNDTTVDANKTYKWRFTPTDVNYTVLTGSIELYHRSSGGGGSYTPSYTVTADKTENGTITVSPKSAYKGDTVTITVKPDKGYEPDTIKVLDQNGDKVKLTEKDGKYTFKMPDSKVEIQATFVKETEISPFGDVSTDAYYYEAVKWAQKKGITGGIGNDLFGPNQPCTRAQIATFLWRAAGSPEPKNMSSFSDVPTDSYYAKAVAWAVENGITTGTGDGKFSPNAPCTRAQSVTFLYRASGSPAVSDSAVFADVEANAFYADAVAWAVANGVTNGTTSSTFSPDNGCTRAQIVTFLYRAFNK